MSDILRLDEITDAHRCLVGGKAFHLARLAAAGFPVPTGFVAPAGAQADNILAAFRSLDGGPVAVRSSAAIEDGDSASFAGLFESVLSVPDEQSLLRAIERVRSSAASPRVRNYCREFGIGSDISMSVLIQRMTRGSVNGVVFTADPGRPGLLLIEASRDSDGSVTAGSAAIHRVHIDRDSREAQSHSHPESLAESECNLLADLCLRAESCLGQPLDIEWSLSNCQFAILQARPITASPAAEIERASRAEIARVREFAVPGRTIWTRDELSESLPLPTPMTWSVFERLLGPTGGMGRMMADLGLTPNTRLPSSGVYDLIAGRPYRNDDRAMREIDPAVADSPDGLALRSGQSAFGLIVRLPILFWKLARTNRRLRSAAGTFPGQFQQEIIPAFRRECEVEAGQDYTTFDFNQLLIRFHDWCDRTLVSFATHSLKPAVLAKALQSRPRPSDELNQRAAIAPEVDLPAAMRRLSRGAIDWATFVHGFGHRGPSELELSQPRWSELPPIRLLPESADPPTTPPAAVTPISKMLGLREMAKHYFMLGYAQIRRILLEIDRRFGLNDGVFYLKPDELPQLETADLSPLIAERRRQRRIWKGVYVPAMLTADRLGEIGQPPPIGDSETLHGTPLAAGIGEGTAAVLREPDSDLPSAPYVLVCPSADPGLTPLLAGAAGLVVEIGGTLSHGAVLAREFGVPTVCVSNALSRVRTGQRIRVDGIRGTVAILSALRD